MSSNLSVIILAAGLGKRMQSNRAKVLHDLAGKPLLAHVLNAISPLSPDQTIVIIGHGADQVRQAFPQQALTFVLQEPPQGTGHAVMQALPHLPHDDRVVLILNGDVPLVQSQTLLNVVAEARRGSLSLLIHELPDAGQYGRIVRGESGLIERIVEYKDANEDERKIREWYTGTMAMPAEKLSAWLGQTSNKNAQNEYYLTDIIALAVKDGVQVRSVTAPTEWEVQGINSRKEQAALERSLQLNLAQELMHQGVTLMDPARLDVRGTLRCEADVSIDVGCVFEGDVVIESDVVIGPYCCIRDTHIGKGARIKAFSHIDGAKVGAQNRIGPYARLRPGTELSKNVHIGNFVELKATTFAEGSKANHLSYVGDSRVGSEVNIGAGTITCNYDGANKHRTIIEDNVHIGSDVQLIAPVTIKAGSTIAAGSTIWKDTDAGELALNPKTQSTKQGWIRPKKKDPA